MYNKQLQHLEIITTSLKQRNARNILVRLNCLQMLMPVEGLVYVGYIECMSV